MYLYRHPLQSFPAAAIAVLWMWFTTIVFFFPATPGASAAEMNYTVVVLGGVLTFAIVYYFFPKYGGIHWFEGPVGRIRLEQGELEDEVRQRSGSIGSIEKRVENVSEEKQIVRD